jgi:hypothetical protein
MSHRKIVDGISFHYLEITFAWLYIITFPPIPSKHFRDCTISCEWFQDGRVIQIWNRLKPLLEKCVLEHICLGEVFTRTSVLFDNNSLYRISTLTDIVGKTFQLLSQ